jgi:small subunit ribosomal protein S17
MGAEEKAQIGTVVSTKMDKTVVVRIDRQKRHRLYGKTLRSTHRYKAHDEKNECNLGDVVRISETRPLSREKRWRVVEIITKGDVADIAPRDIGARIIEETREAAAAEAATRAAASAPLATETAAADEAQSAVEDVDSEPAPAGTEASADETPADEESPS